MSFWDCSFLWFEAVISAVALGATCAFLGVYMLMRRVVFLPAAISQIAGLGVVLAFLLAATFELRDLWLFDPIFFSTVMSLGAALAIGWMPEPRRLSREAIIGVAYILSWALIIAIGELIPQESHDINDLLFGNAVAVERSQMWVALLSSGLVISIHLLAHSPFMLVSFDRETALAHELPVRLVDGVLFLTLGLIASQATRTIGALPVFAFSVVAPAAALMLSQHLSVIFGLAALIGAGAAFLGYWISFQLSLPTGACMAATTGAIWLALTLAKLTLKLPRLLGGKSRA